MRPVGGLERQLSAWAAGALLLGAASASFYLATNYQATLTLLFVATVVGPTATVRSSARSRRFPAFGRDLRGVIY